MEWKNVPNGRNLPSIEEFMAQNQTSDAEHTMDIYAPISLTSVLDNGVVKDFTYHYGTETIVNINAIRLIRDVLKYSSLPWLFKLF